MKSANLSPVLTEGEGKRDEMVGGSDADEGVESKALEREAEKRDPETLVADEGAKMEESEEENLES